MKNSHEEVELSIVMPCLNEEESLPTCLDNAFRFANNGFNVNTEIIIADNGSTDRSLEIAEQYGVRIVHAKKRGYGAALQEGIRHARGRYVVMGDADASYDFYHLMPFVEQLREGHDLVMGNRYRGGIQRGAMPLLHRYFGNPALTAMAKLFFRVPVNDVYCGLRGFNRAAVRDLYLRRDGMEFALEMVVKAALMKMNIAEVPTTLVPDARSRCPHLKTWRDGFRSLRFYVSTCVKVVFSDIRLPFADRNKIKRPFIEQV